MAILFASAVLLVAFAVVMAFDEAGQAAVAGVGAIATQAWANPRYGPDGLALLRARGAGRARAARRAYASGLGGLGAGLDFCRPHSYAGSTLTST